MTQRPPIPRRTHPLWRGIFCLLLGCAAWWLVTWWLEPRPLWVRPAVPEHVQAHPLVEGAAGKYVVGYWLQSKFAEHYMNGLVVLDQATGKEVQRTRTDKSVSISSEAPRFRGDSLWRLGNVEEGVALFRWDFTRSNKEEVVKQWPRDWWQGVMHDWSADGSTAMIKVHFSLSPYVALLDWSGWLRPILLSDNRAIDLLWFETWRLPETRDAPPKLDCRWTPHYSRWGEPLRLSGDGHWAAFREYTLDDKVLERLRKSKAQWTGDELTQLVRRSPAGAMVYDTETGRLVHQFPVGKALHYWMNWYGSTLLLEQLQPKAMYDKVEEFPGWRHPINEAYDFASGLAVPVELPLPLRKSTIVPKEINGLLLVSIPSDDRSQLHDYMTLQRQGNALVIRDQWLRRRTSGGIDSLWVSDCCRETWMTRDPKPSLMQTLLEKLPQWDWLDKWLDRLFHAHSLAVMIPSGQHEASLIRRRMLAQSDLLRRHIYLIDQPWHESGRTYGQLECYRVPVVVYSSWWGRVVGLVVVLLVWLIMTRRARRLA
jgi:hypothetical protein